MRVERLPFTVYDIVGYLVPGVVVFWIISILFLSFLDINNFSEIQAIKIFGNTIYSDIITFVIFFIFSYLTGHIISFLSSVTIEKILICYVGYPSKHLISKTEHNKEYWRNLSSRNISANIKYFRVIFIHLPMLPILPCLWFLIFTGWISTIIKQLPSRVSDTLAKKYEEVSEHNFDLENPGKNWFLYICYCIINRHPNASLRLYNYITIYGFLRSFCFIFITSAWVLLYRSFTDCEYILAFIISLLASSILFMAFIKFYRRYSEETIMAFIWNDHESNEASN